MYEYDADEFALCKWFEKHDEIYGKLGAAVLAKIMEYELNGQCFKYPRKKAAAMFDLKVDDFEYLIKYLRDIGAVCLAGNAIVSNPYRVRVLEAFVRR